MRYTRNMSGLNRLMKSREFKSAPDYYYKTQTPPPEESVDTKIRKDIYSVINRMIKEGKNDIQIEMYLTNLYPKYSEYILKMISHQFSKINVSKAANSKGGKTGEAR